MTLQLAEARAQVALLPRLPERAQAPVHAHSQPVARLELVHERA
jgi:hypothetical protein